MVPSVGVAAIKGHKNCLNGRMCRLNRGSQAIFWPEMVLLGRYSGPIWGYKRTDQGVNLMADDSRVSADIARSPDPSRGPYIKLTDAARELDMKRKALISQVNRHNPSAAWVDVSGQRIKWFYYRDALPPAASQSLDQVAAINARVESLTDQVQALQQSKTDGELADLRARVVRAEATISLLTEAYELQESANQRFRQALSLHHTPGHIGELLDLRAGTKDAAEDGGSGSRGR